MSLETLQLARPRTAVILGSGLGDVAEAFGVEAELAYAEVPGLGEATVPGHAGRFVLGRIESQPVLFAQGRRHLYEGLTGREVAAGVRFLGELGVERLVITNAAGAIRSDLAVGGLMLITDHLNLLADSPLTGGPHFQDMTEVYSRSWRQGFITAADRLGISLFEGVYAAVRGPQYETPAEIRMLRTVGADAVGMSTVPEAIQARALGMEVVGVSMLTNWAAGLGEGSLHHDEVVETGRVAAKALEDLLRAALF
jgi:purine-nucleoside phosphorylase